jgi:recombination protein RecR
LKNLPSSVQKLIEHFSKLPGVGPKSASRMVFHLLNSNMDNVVDFANTLKEMKENIKFCLICHNLAESKECAICSSTNRDAKQIMVVEDVLDLIAFEKTKKYQGRYHVLGGVISPVNGIGPDEININTLIDRVNSNEIKEIILATNPNLEGEATAMYISEEIKNINDKIAVTRIARGIPSGADLDYADDTTLTRSLEGRITF